MEAPTGQEGDPGFWKQCWEAERQEFLRSERVQNQLQAVLQQLQQRCKELESDNGRIRTDVRPDSTCEQLESEVLAARQAGQALEARESALSLHLSRHNAESVANEAEADTHLQALAECKSEIDLMEEAYCNAEANTEKATLEARSLVMAEALHRTCEEAAELRVQLKAQEDDTAQLRQALIDSWAARADEDNTSVSSEPVDPGNALSALDGMEEELRWLAKMQQESAAEVHHVQKLERTEATLQAQLREVSEQNAMLRNARMDLGDAGRAMREAIASQSERYVGRVDGLAEERKRTDTDREKLMQECAELQLRLDDLSPQLSDLFGVEERHKELYNEQQAIATESDRLHIVNTVLSVLLLGDDAPPGMAGDEGVAEAITRLLQLQRRLTDREASHSEEKHNLAERIRGLERDVASKHLQEEQPPTKATAVAKSAVASSRSSKKSSVPNSFSSASSMLKGGLRGLREATGV